MESVLFSMEKREAERNRIKGTLGGKTGTTVVEQNDFQIVCGNMYSAIFMMNSSGYGESLPFFFGPRRIFL
jgi:hypothetical protein